MRIRGNIKTFVVNTTISYNFFHKLLDVIEEMRVNNHGAYFITLIKGNQDARIIPENVSLETNQLNAQAKVYAK